MATGLSHKAMTSIIKGEIDMCYVSMVGRWRIKVRGDQVISSTLCYEDNDYVTYDIEDNYINLKDLSMDRPQINLTT